MAFYLFTERTGALSALFNRFSCCNKIIHNKKYCLNRHVNILTSSTLHCDQRWYNSTNFRYNSYNLHAQSLLTTQQQHILKNVKDANLSKARFLSTTKSQFSISRFVPLSSKTLFKKLIQEKEKSDGEGSGLFEKFTLAVDQSIANTNYCHLPELKILYDPLNPDNTTLASKSFTNKELVDREFWFLQKFAFHLEKAGFAEVDKGHLFELLAEKPVGKGVVADVQTDKFQILRYWVLGDLTYPHPLSSSSSSTPPSTWTKRLSFLIGEPESRKLFKRVVVASRLKDDKKLSLKLYKDVPSNRLHLLLPPSGGLKMHPTYRNLILYSTSLSAFFLLSRYAVLWLLGDNHHLGYLPVSFSAFFGISSVALWSVYKQRQKRYLTDVLDIVYDHFVVGNQNILPVVMDKCQEELLKVVLLTYFFLTSHPSASDDKEGSAELTAEKLNSRISKWLEEQTGQLDINFKCNEGLRWLNDVGMVSVDGQTGVIQCQPLENALKLLPTNNLASSFPTIKVDEFDLFYGDLSEATNLEKTDLIDKITSAIWSRVNRFQRRF